VNVQAQSDAFTLTAQKAVDVQSTTDCIEISAPEKIVLNGGGSYVRIEGGNIEIGTSGPAKFLAGMKVLTGGGSASPQLPVLPGSEFSIAMQLRNEQGQPLRHRKVRLIREDGSSEIVQLDGAGRTPRIDTGRHIESIKVQLAEREQWRLLDDDEAHEESLMQCEFCQPAFRLPKAEDMPSEEAP